MPLIISKATSTSSGSPGPFDSMTPSGDMPKISSADVSYGTTVTLQPRKFNSRTIFCFLPKSSKTTLKSEPVDTYGVFVETV